MSAWPAAALPQVLPAIQEIKEIKILGTAQACAGHCGTSFEQDQKTAEFAIGVQLVSP